MEEKELLQAIRQIVEEENEPIQREIATMKGDMSAMDGKIDRLKEDVAGLKEDSAVTRNGVNTLLDWAEKVQVSIPLFPKGRG